MGDDETKTYVDRGNWITLHRKLLENPIISNPELLQLFIVLLLLANHETHRFLWNGKETDIVRGQLITGRLKLAQITKQNPRTLYDRLKVLERLTMISLESNNKFSLITIVKYNQYQDKPIVSNNKPTTNQQQTNTYNNDNNVTSTNAKALVRPDNRNPGIQELWDYGIKLGLPPTKQQSNRFALKRLLRDSTVEKLKTGIEYALKIKNEAYAPQVHNWLDLEEKLPKLRDWVTRQNKKTNDTKGIRL